jgi:hypothetical protein
MPKEWGVSESVKAFTFENPLLLKALSREKIDQYIYI